MTDLPEGFVWVQRDALELRHEPCGETVRAESLDLHLRSCPQ